jgi:transcriptional regulator with XRE-family HTH domain
MDLQQLKQDMAGLDITNAALAAIADVSAGRLSEILSGLRAPGEDKERIETAIADLKGLQAEYVDVPLNFRAAIKIKQILENRKQGPARELQSIIRELNIPFSAFVQLQVHEPVSLLDANRALNGAGADPAHTRALLQLAHQLQDYAQTFPEPRWDDVYAIKSVLARWAAQARERAARQ